MSTFQFDEELALRYGVNEAIMLNNFIFWLKKNKANNTNYFDGNWWTYNSARAYSELFPFWSQDQIKRILKSLVDQGVLITGNYHEDKYNRSNWYALCIEHINLIDSAKSHHALGEIAQSKERNHPMSLGEIAPCSSKTDNKTQIIKPDIIPQTPNHAPEGAGVKPVSAESLGLNQQHLNIELPTDNQQQMAINAWMAAIKNKGIDFSNYELKAIEFRAKQFPRMQPWEIDNELILVDKLAWEGKDIENVLRSGYRSLATAKAVLRVETDAKSNRIYSIDQLNSIRENRIAREKAQREHTTNNTSNSNLANGGQG